MKLTTYIPAAVLMFSVPCLGLAHDELWNLDSGPAVGAIVGGVIGYQIDKRDGAVAGSILGSLAGSRYSHQSRHDRARIRHLRLHEEQRQREIVQQRIQTETRHYTLSSDDLFTPGTAMLVSSASAEIASIAETLKRHDRTVVHVNGHTDNEGQEYQNKVLSLAQAESVARQLLIRGIPRTRIHTSGFGEGQPVADNTSGDQRRLNRRIEILVEPVFGNRVSK